MKSFFPLLSCLLFVFLTGCASNVNSVQRVNPQARANVIEDMRIVTDRTLAWKLEIYSLNETQVIGDLLQVQALIGNKTSKPQTFAYKFEWVAEDGMDFSAGNGWRTITLLGKEQRAISAIATSPRVVDFRLKFQEN